MLRFILLFPFFYVLLFSSELLAQQHDPEFVDGTIVFPLREVRDDRSKIYNKPAPTIRTLPDGFAYPVIPEEDAEDFARYILDVVQEYELPGFAFAIVQGNTITVQKTKGRRSLKNEAPIDPSTLFNVGPVTQALTSLLAATHSSEKASAFDRPARKIYPPFSLSDSHSQKSMTIRHLLNMTGGIPDYTDNILDPAWARPEDIFEVMSQSPIIAQPGQVFNYSNVSVSSAGYLLAYLENSKEDIHQRFTESVKKRLFTPMGMNEATFSLAEAKATQNYASPHKKNSKGKFQAVSRWEPSTNPFTPSIGLKANLKDMTSWLTTELQEGQTANGQQVAPSFAVRERWKPTHVQKKINSGMGWTRQIYKKTEIIANTGSYDRHTCGLGFMPRYRTGFIVFVNTNSPDAAKVIQEVALGLTELLVEL